MPACSYISWLGPYYDGELTEQRSAELQKHLRQCTECAAALEELRALSRRLLDTQGAPPVMAPAALRRLHQHVDQLASLSDRSIRRFAEILSGLAAALLIASSVWMLEAPQASAEPVAPWERAAAVLRSDSRPANDSLTTARWIVTELQRERQQH